MKVKEHGISHSVDICAPGECVWRHITDVDIVSFRHPVYLSALGVPKPLRAEIIDAGIGGSRIAYFDNDKRFTQEITSWKYPERYSFAFRADPGFRVGYFLDLAEGPFRVTSATYIISPVESGVRLKLESRYELRGAMGACLYLPVWLVLNLYQRYLLRGIKANAERDHAQGNNFNRDRGAV
jgi:hypothetical protein